MANAYVLHCGMAAIFMATSVGQASEIFRCQASDGGTVLQQQPCSSDTTLQRRYQFSPEKRDRDTSGPAELPTADKKPANSRPSRSSARRSRVSQPSSVGKRATQCRKLLNKAEDIRNAERDGYSAAEGEKMRRDLRRIRRDKKQLNCQEFDR